VGSPNQVWYPRHGRGLLAAGQLWGGVATAFLARPIHTRHVAAHREHTFGALGSPEGSGSYSNSHPRIWGRDVVLVSDRANDKFSGGREESGQNQGRGVS